MSELAEFMKARIQEDMGSCELEIRFTGEVPRAGWPTSPERVLESLKVQLKLVEAYESYAANPQVHMDVTLYTLMSTLRAVVTDFARAYVHHPDYPR
jgi:hypothetical protein